MTIGHVLTSLIQPKVAHLFSTWGRYVDRDVFYSVQPDHNPDPIDEGSTGDRYFRISMSPHVKAGLIYIDASRLFVTAGGLPPDELGMFHPPQLIYTSPDKFNQEHFDALSNQYDEQFDGGFNAILKSLQDPALIYGRAIGEISWQRDGERVFADFIWSRDPEEFVFSPPNKRPGLYRKKHLYSSAWSEDLIRMPDGKFIFMPYDPLFNNPYGQSLLRPLAKIVETWQGTGVGVEDDEDQKGILDAWREGLKKAGFGFILGAYSDMIAGNDSASKSARALFLTQLKKLRSATAGIFHEKNTVRTEQLSMDSGLFVDFYTAYVQTISVLLTGSATALSEGKFGSYAKEESTTVRQKSEREQMNALMLGSVFTYQFNRFFLHYNFGHVDVIPQLQLIPPERIMPTTPEGQETNTNDDTPVIVTEQDESETESEPSVEMQEGRKKKHFRPSISL